MTFEEFIEKLHVAGWRSPLDAQHTEIAKLWEELIDKGITIPMVRKETP